MSKKKERRRQKLLNKIAKREENGSYAYDLRQEMRRYAEEKLAEQEIKAQPPKTNAEALHRRLTLGRVPRALSCTLVKILGSNGQTGSPTLTDAFVQVLTTLRPDCEAAVAARGVAAKLKMPLDRLGSREQMLQWLSQPPSTRPACPPEPTSAGGGCLGTGPASSAAQQAPINQAMPVLL